MYLLPRKSRSSHRSFLYKKAYNLIRKSLQYRVVFKKTYFEKRLWTAASEIQNLSDKFSEGRSFLIFLSF